MSIAHNFHTQEGLTENPEKENIHITFVKPAGKLSYFKRKIEEKHGKVL
jgi:hypothetical protein